MKTCAVILAGGEGSRLGVLTAERTKPAVPFGGKYRIIDFALSNCVNSGLFDVMILTQYRPHSLIEHIGAGGPWDLNREMNGGVRIYSPYRSRESAGWFVGTANAVQQNFLFIKDRQPDIIVILSGDHIYRMNYQSLVQAHVSAGAHATLATIQVSPDDASRFGIVSVDDAGWATSFVEKPEQPPSHVANMGVYVFNYDTLDRALLEDRERADSNHDFGRDILPRLIADPSKKVFTWPYGGYWRDVGTLQSYWEAHMDLLGDEPEYDLNDLGWLIHTRSENRSPAYVGAGASIGNSLLSHGCVVEAGATIERSVLGPGVRVQKGAVIRGAVILNNCDIGAGARVERAILDKRAQIGSGCQVGQAGLADEGALAVVGKSSQLPPNFVVEAGGEVGHNVVPADLISDRIPAGRCVQTQRRPWEVDPKPRY